MVMPNQMYAVSPGQQTEYLQQHIYDRINYPTTGLAGNQAIFFSTALGGSATLISTVNGAPTTVVKTYRDTNWAIPNFVADRIYSFSGMNVKIIRYTTTTTGSDATDTNTIMSNGWLSFQVGDKYILWTPLLDVPVFNPITASTVNNSEVMSNGSVVPVYTFGDPIVVNPGQTFRVYLNYPGLCTITTSVDIMLTLYSTLVRQM